MKSYKVNIVDKNGIKSSEIIVAENVEALVNIVKSRSLFLMDYKETQYSQKSLSKLRLKSIVIFCRQLGTMINSGISIMKSLSMLIEKADSLKAKRVYRSVYEEVQKGNALSIAMKSQEGVFPELLVNMVSAGEIGGTLDRSLMRMAVHYEKEARIRNKIRGASIYPAVLGVFSIAVVLGLVTFVLPSLTSMFRTDQIPWTTAMLLNFSDFIINNALFLVIFVVVLIGLIIILFRIRKFRLMWDKFILFFPVIGKLNQTIYSARAARALSSLYSSGVQVLDMIETAGRVLNNTYLEDMFILVVEKVSRGELISRAISETNSFDPMLSSMIYVGEETGELGDILDATANYFDDEADSAIQRMIALIEPIMIVLLGFAIGFIIISIIQPIFQMYEMLG